MLNLGQALVSPMQVPCSLPVCKQLHKNGQLPSISIFVVNHTTVK